MYLVERNSINSLLFIFEIAPQHNKQAQEEILDHQIFMELRKCQVNHQVCDCLEDYLA